MATNKKTTPTKSSLSRTKTNSKAKSKAGSRVRSSKKRQLSFPRPIVTFLTAVVVLVLISVGLYALKESGFAGTQNQGREIGVRFATYNVRTSHLDNAKWGDSDGRYDGKDGERMRGVAGIIKDRDLAIVAAQEVRHDERSGLLANLPGYHATNITSNSDTAIFWKGGEWEMVRSNTYRIPVRSGTTRPQVYALFKHKTTGKKLYVFSVHYAASSGRAPLRLEAAKISENVIQKTAVAQGIPFVLAGDMNENDRVRGGVVDYLGRPDGVMRYARAVAAQKFRNDCDTHNARSGLSGHQECGRRNGGSHIDHVWVSKNPKLEVKWYNVYATDATSRISDHNPVITALSY